MFLFSFTLTMAYTHKKTNQKYQLCIALGAWPVIGFITSHKYVIGQLLNIWDSLEDQRTLLGSSISCTLCHYELINVINPTCQ